MNKNRHYHYYSIRRKVFKYIIIITFLGLCSKLYSGYFEQWVNDSLGGVFYEIFWCLFLFFLIPLRKTISKISLIVFVFTCIIEFIQLWKHPYLEVIRGTFLGRTLIGTTFVVTDFIYYFLGSVTGWFVLKNISDNGNKFHSLQERQNE